MASFFVVKHFALKKIKKVNRQTMKNVVGTKYTFISVVN